jgi:exopolysaccharide production protein ExoQ
MYIGMRYEPKQQLKMIALVVGLGAVASLAVIVFLPGAALTQGGDWQGVYHLKNALGRMMALGLLCFGMLALSQRRHRTERVVMFLLCCALLWLSKSATAFVVSILMLALLPFRKVLSLRTRQLVAVAAILVPFAACALFWFAESSEQIFLALGRTSSLTGRIPLWQMVMREIAGRPFLGYGFTAFWHSWEGERVSDAVAWEAAVPNAHNGFLELWLGLGIIGLAIVVIGLWRNFRFAVRAARNHREIDQAWPLLLIAFTVCYNLTETSLLAVNSILWMAYVANSFWMVRVVQEEKYELALEQEQQELAYST